MSDWNETAANVRRLSVDELFRITPRGLEPISDATLELKLASEEREALKREEPKP